ncbi:MAG: hypothetical protein V2A34_12985 [Lentisphaerota bacterium]
MLKRLMMLWAMMGVAVPLFADQAPFRLGIWCEFLPFSQVEETLPLLAKYDCELMIHVERQDIGNADFVRLCRRAEKLGVPVVGWFLLPYSEHLYVGEASLDAIRDFSLSFADWANKEKLMVSSVVFDCEPSPLLGKQLFDKARKADLLGLAEVMKREKDPKRFEQSVERLNTLIDALRARGFKVRGAGNRVFLDFLHRQNTVVEDALNAPVTMIHWDEISFITYRYRASQVDYVAMVNRYAELSRQYFGPRAGLDLGLLGDHRGIPENVERAELFGGGSYFMSYLEGMRSTADLQEVVGVALGQGVRRINLYSLDGAITSVAGLEWWLKAARDTQPISGLTRWTPVRSIRMDWTGFMMEGLFRVLVGSGTYKDQKPDSGTGATGGT